MFHNLQLDHLWHHGSKGPDNPTRQLLPIMSTKCCSGAGQEGKTKEVKDRKVKTIVCDKVVCERWCVKVVCERERVTKLVCDKVVCER